MFPTECLGRKRSRRSKYVTAVAGYTLELIHPQSFAALRGYFSAVLGFGRTTKADRPREGDRDGIPTFVAWQDVTVDGGIRTMLFATRPYPTGIARTRGRCLLASADAV
jgi:hypothetical protein